MYSALLAIHIFGGFLSLLSAFVSAASKALPIPHKWHSRSGNIFFAGMCIVFGTAIPMTLLRPNTFLFLTALFSIYMAVTGWRCARVRSGEASRFDRFLIAAILVTSVAMLFRGIGMLSGGDSMGWVMCAFFAVGTVLGISDIQGVRAGGVRGKNRIAKHVSRMLGGTIATVTAFVVTNFRMDPMVILWLAPGVLIGPLAFWWTVRIRKGTAKYSMK